MTTEEHSIYIKLQGATYYAVHQLTAETNLSLSSALDLLVAKGCELIELEDIGNSSYGADLSDALDKITKIQVEIIKGINNFSNEFVELEEKLGQLEGKQ